MNFNQSNVCLNIDFPCKLIVQKNFTDLIGRVVDVLEDRLRRRLVQSAPKPLGLATGRTMEPIYKSLMARLKSWPDIELEKLVKTWCSFNLDEYVGLSESDDASYIAYMIRHIGRPLNLAPNQMRVPNGRSEDPEKEASSYLEELRNWGGVSIQLLGLGVNGHLGFNEPPCGANVSCRVVSLSYLTRQQNAFAFQNNPDLVPAKAITLGLEEILLADEIHLIVSGFSKANILSSLLTDSASEKLPASWLRKHPNMFLWADYEALSGLPPTLLGSNSFVS